MKALVTGPAVHREVPSPELGLSFAVTCASHAAKARLEETFYVRVGDDVYGYAESYTDGTASIFRTSDLVVG